jgi:DNA-binding Lrp family transcriptional regulator
MDLNDRVIISEVCSNCRVSYESLARKTGLSPSTVKNRVGNLIESGFFSQFRAILDPRLMEADSFQAIVITNGTENIEEFVNLIGVSPMVGHINTMASVTGGAYLVWGMYSGTENLSEIGTFLRGLREVQEVELHPLRKMSPYDPHHPPPRAKKIRFTKTQKRVLNVLVKNPRTLISDIAQETGISPKTVRRALRQITDGGSVRFIARPDLATGSLVNLNIRISWDEKRISIDELTDWLRKEYPIEFWNPFISASAPVAFAEFMVGDLHNAEAISKRIRELPFVTSSTTLVSYSSAKFPYLAEIMLQEMVADAGT